MQAANSIESKRHQERIQRVKEREADYPTEGSSPKKLLQNSNLAEAQGARVRQKGLINSHSNKRLPTEQ